MEVEKRADRLATVFHDAAGNRWEVLLDVDELGPQSFVAIRARALDRRGREVLRSEPNLLVTNGKEATMEIAGPDGQWFHARVPTPPRASSR